MDAKTPAKRKEVIEFLEKYERFIVKLKELNAEIFKRGEEDPDIETMKWRFIKTVEQPMDDAWKKLDMKEKEECLILIFKKPIKE